MQRVTTLGVTLALAWWLTPSFSVWLGITVTAAALAGRLVERIHLPRLTGYLVFGLMCGPAVLGAISQESAAGLQRINGLAIALIAFTAGLQLELGRLRPRLRVISTMAVVTIGLTSIGLYGLLYGLWAWLPIAPDVAGTQRAALVLVATAVLVGFSPTVTMAVLSETKARGPLTDLTLATVVLGDLVLILLFAVAMVWAAGGAPALAWALPLSVLLGLAAGAAFAAYQQWIGRAMPLAFVVAAGMFAWLAATWQLDGLIMAMTAGLVAVNLDPARAAWLPSAWKLGAAPVLLIFFTAAGASLHLGGFASMAVAAAALVSARMALLWAGASIGAALVADHDPATPLLWRGLVSQAGVTLGLTLIVASQFPDWGGRFETLMVTVIAIHELIGPVLFKSALVQAGETGRATT